MRRIIFLHGMESSPEGTKATYLKEQFGAISPALRHLGLREQVDLASKYLIDMGHSITETAFYLGFSESSAFHRAFRRWFDQTPAEYLDGRR